MTAPLPERFDAATPAEPETQDPLERQQLEVATRGLEAALDRIAEDVAVAREQEAREGLDASTLALLDALAGVADASLERRSLHGRVAAGRITWEQVWTYPGAEAGGRALVLDVIRHQASDGVAARLRFIEAEAAEGHDRGK